MSKSAIVPSEYHGQRVDQVLAKIFPEYSRSQLTLWLKSGLISINQQNLKPKEKVLGGEVVLMQVPEREKLIEDKAEDIPLDIIYEDDDILIINKAAGLVVHPGAGNPEHTLVNALLYHDPKLAALPRAGIVHRLDKDTSGLLITAKNLESYTALVRKMQDREIDRHYLALVYGHLIAGQTIETKYGRHPRNRLKMAVCKEGKEAITEFTVRKQYQCASLLELQLHTGRTHQIRVHMAHINHPIVGDPLYGGRSKIPAAISDSLRQSLKAFKRQALHAYFLSLAHPMSEEIVTFSAPIPEDFQSLLNILDNYLE